ncbi:MAG TPA: AbrB/MazE/SpoVT family DNA-binding domain-containing protein [Phenylobacterium sp.]|jgi:antitoxin VapB
MTTVTSRVFRSGNSEAVRLPKDVAFGRDVEVTIVRSGDVLTIYPKRPSIQEMLAELDRLPVPGKIEERDPDIWPDREGL